MRDRLMQCHAGIRSHARNPSGQEQWHCAREKPPLIAGKGVREVQALPGVSRARQGALTFRIGHDHVEGFKVVHGIEECPSQSTIGILQFMDGHGARRRTVDLIPNPMGAPDEPEHWSPITCQGDCSPFLSRASG